MESQIQLMTSHRALMKVAGDLKLNERENLPFDDQGWRKLGCARSFSRNGTFDRGVTGRTLSR